MSGQDCTRGRSIGTFVSSVMGRLMEKSVLASVSWAGTPTKAAMKDFEALIEVIIG